MFDVIKPFYIYLPTSLSVFRADNRVQILATCAFQSHKAGSRTVVVTCHRTKRLYMTKHFLFPRIVNV
jgi:hypothetical protein